MTHVIDTSPEPERTLRIIATAAYLTDDQKQKLAASIMENYNRDKGAATA